MIEVSVRSLCLEKMAKKTTGACRKMWGEDGNGMRPIKLNTA
jgi:hypothetical protein